MSNLEKLLTTRNAQTLVNIFLKNTLSCVVDAKSQQILAISDELIQMLECNNPLHTPLAAVEHQLSGLAKGFFLKRLNRFRLQQLSSTWFMILQKRHSSQLQLFEISDCPIYDANELVGSLIRMKEVSMAFNKRRYQFINKLLENAAEKAEHVLFSRLEYEVLYLSAMGKSPKEISTLLEPIADRRISHSSIAAVINKRIYPKMGTFSMSQTVEKALLSDSITSFPQTFLELSKNKFVLIETTQDIINLTC
jgi:hypothetical protein